MTAHERFSDGSPWEPRVGYVRAVRAGECVYVSGTTAVDDSGEVVGEGSSYDQARYALSKAVRALEALGASPGDVVRTRWFVTRIDDWEEVGRAHREVFGAIPPASTMVGVPRLIDPRLLVEVEMDAVVDPASPPRV
ncbi:MAG: RidA family protein [Thermoplasmata archaeon]|nr:RidA family protein [Thermoplasmata archaeon]MCI4356685.1 RidA family protein [Thermoplasmata archaeon]